MSESDRPDEQVIDGDADLDAILLALDTAGRELPVEAIREARRCRNAIIPKLIQVLQTASAAVRSGATHEGQAPFFALFLLTEFQAKEALPAILEAVSLPGELPFDLFGDGITSLLARVLASLAGERLEVFDQLIRDQELNKYVRWEGAQVYRLLVRDGRLSRLEAVQYLQRHLREPSLRVQVVY
jgi:HEAT repeat protein